MPAIVYSIVLPFFNEQENLPELYNQLTETMSQIGEPYELLFVDDGSVDSSPQIIASLRTKDERVKLVRLSRNFGHQSALTAGLTLAAGQAVIAMDTDLQDSPQVIPAFVEQWKKGAEVVYAIRQSRQEDMFKKLAYSTFYRILRKLSDFEIPIDSGDFSLMDRKVVDLINSLPEKTRYVRGLRAWVGFRQVGVQVDRSERFAGKSKYSFFRLLNLALAGVISSSVVPLRVATGLGMVVSIASFLSIILVFYFRLFTKLSIPGFAAMSSILLLLGGIQLLTVGVLGEYVGRIFEEVKGRPLFIIAEALGIEGKNAVEK